MTKAKQITQDELENLMSILEYNSETGDFTWKETGKFAGYYNPKGYIQIRKGKLYRAHRLALAFIFKKDIPDYLYVDHINGIRSDNRLSNLRLTTNKENCNNRQNKMYYYNKITGKFIFYRIVKGVIENIEFETEEELIEFIEKG